MSKIIAYILFYSVSLQAMEPEWMLNQNIVKKDCEYSVVNATSKPMFAYTTQEFYMYGFKHDNEQLPADNQLPAIDNKKGNLSCYIATLKPFEKVAFSYTEFTKYNDKKQVSGRKCIRRKTIDIQYTLPNNQKKQHTFTIADDKNILVVEDFTQNHTNPIYIPRPVIMSEKKEVPLSSVQYIHNIICISNQTNLPAKLKPVLSYDCSLTSEITYEMPKKLAFIINPGCEYTFSYLIYADKKDHACKNYKDANIYIDSCFMTCWLVDRIKNCKQKCGEIKLPIKSSYYAIHKAIISLNNTKNSA